jgi:hypothetical protein
MSDPVEKLLPVGSHVRVHSLAGRTELNGKRGRVVSAESEAGRNAVKIQGEPKPVPLRPRNLEATKPPSLAELGYAYVCGPSDDPDDFVLRSSAYPTEGFQWRGQENYDDVADACFAWIRSQLVERYGLRALPCKGGPTAYASPELGQSAAPLLILICGAAPGGDAGVWGRALIVNDSTLSGSMFSYVRRAQGLGWSVLIADPHGGDACPHAHVAHLWKSTVMPSSAARVMIVAHSYGAPVAVSLLKADVSARRRITAIAMTDGMVFVPGEGWSRSHEALLSERIPSEDEAAMEPGGKAMREMLFHYAEAAPHAFEERPGRWMGESPAAVLAAIGRNFVCSESELGATITANDGEMVALSAGSDRHDSTSRAAEPAVFEFLQKGAAGEAKAANDRVRAGNRAWPPPPAVSRFRSLRAIKPFTAAGCCAAVSVGTCAIAAARFLMWALFGGGAARIAHM